MEKLLVTSNFSFSHSVFKRFVLQTRENQGLFRKGLMIWLCYRHHVCFDNIRCLVRLIIPPQKQMFRGYAGIGSSLVQLSVCLQNMCSFVLQTPTVLLLLYRNIIDTLLVSSIFSFYPKSSLSWGHLTLSQTSLCFYVSAVHIL